VRFLWTILRDVSERVAAARSLEETKNMLEQGEAVVRMGSWVYDSDTRDLRWSRQMFTNMGMPWSPRPPSIDAYCARIHPDDVGPVRAAIDQLVAGADVPEVRFRTHPDLGPVRWMRRVVQKIERAAEGKGPSYVGTLLDVSDAVRVEDRLRAINEELERRVAERTDAAAGSQPRPGGLHLHRLARPQSPLRGIDGYSQLLIEDHGARLWRRGPDVCRAHRKGILQMGDLISDLLDYSRMERRTMEPQALAIVGPGGEGHGGPRGRYRSPAGRGSASAGTGDAPGRPRRHGRRVAQSDRQCHQVQRGQPKPQIEVGSRVDTEHCLLWVRDNGVGFDMQYHDRIFGIFQRLHRAEDYPGTGVGLALVAKAVQRMGGRVWAESRPGEGATFFMEFPR
jgi:signal transduction histidine kinase